MPRVYVGIGSNLGSRARNIARGLELLTDQGFNIVKTSPIYETEPVGMPGGRRFLNLVVAADTRHSPRGCLTRLKQIERCLGRRPDPRHAPRTLDLDLLLYGRQVVREADLRVPHPRLTERAFVLVPFADIAPGVVHPILHQRIGVLARTIGRKGVRRWMGH